MLGHLDRTKRAATKFCFDNRGRHHFDDYYGAALEGLCQAASAFQPEMGNAFWTFAIHRVIGAMRDQRRAFQMGSRKDPKGEPVFFGENLVLERVIHHRGHRTWWAPDPQLTADDLCRIFDRHLDPRAAAIAKRYFIEKEPLSAIGRSLDLTESRVCQIMRKVTDGLSPHFGAPRKPKQPKNFKKKTAA